MSILQSPLFEIGKAMDTGRKRAGSPNQDGLSVATPLFRCKPLLLIVADGMGGHAGGAIASKCVINAFTKPFRMLCRHISPKTYLEESLRKAHQEICKRATLNDSLSGMGSTVIAAVLDEKTLHIINVGDSRLYLLRDNEISQVSYDQSIVAEMVRQGEITTEEAQNHPKRNQLTMSITSRRKEIVPNYSECSLGTNDVILLCSDGLWGVVPESVIRATACQLAPQAAANKLIQIANSMGGPDNISVVIVRRIGSSLEVEPDDRE